MMRFLIKNRLLIGLSTILFLYIIQGCQETIYGCTYTNACNYNPEATIDDASCDYEMCIGCTNSYACNYNPEATIDDASCEYALDNLEPWQLAWWDCDGNFIDHRTQYIGEWEFHVERYIDYDADGTKDYDYYQFYIDSITYSDMQELGEWNNQIEIPFNWNNDTWTFRVNEFGELQAEEWGMSDFENIALFSYYSLDNDFNNFLEMDISNYYQSPTITNDSLLYMNVSQSFWTWMPGMQGEENHFIYYIYAKKLN
ncbi:MAG: hypothetical protein CMD27_00305 [Flavobacteriales bacterium]|nr:hypothetical protein [Flavobacteriales bacterium]